MIAPSVRKRYFTIDPYPMLIVKSIRNVFSTNVVEKLLHKERAELRRRGRWNGSRQVAESSMRL
jgi:hypothetical protein